MSDIDDFKSYLESHQAAFAAWGRFVAEEIRNQLSNVISPVPVANFLKIEAKPRVKEISSALAKIGRKNYTSPQTQMTDLVGVRFVVLLAEHIQIVCEIIESSSQWNAKVSKDFADEIQQNPKAFDYQSKHYEIRPKQAFITPENVSIPADLCCEVQVRSLLQHAYAELVHDNIYKPDGNVPKKAEREVAKSMALMETTDDLFSRTLAILKEANQPQEELLSQLSHLYQEEIGLIPKVDKKTNMIFLETFQSSISQSSILSDIRSLLNEKKYIAKRIKENAEEMYFFSQPAALLVYWLIEKVGADEVCKNWPLPAYNKNLKFICTDLDKQPSHELF